MSLVLGIALALALPVSSVAETSTKKAEPFNLSRFNGGVEAWFSPFYVTETKPLREALGSGKIRKDTQVLVTETAAGRLALLTEQMAYHHIAQGVANGRPWMATFCVVCNTGVTMIPTLDGKEQLFTIAGLYNGLMMMKDLATGTLWNHFTGEAVYGKLTGHQLPVSNLSQMEASQALALDPEIRVAISDRPFVGRRAEPGNPDWEVPEYFVGTIGVEDMRRPRMDSGLGIWTAGASRYYPLQNIRKRGEVFMDDIDGRKVLIYIDPKTSVPDAIFVDSESARFKGQEIRLDNGFVVRMGTLLDKKGRIQPVDRPRLVFTRWYGFSLTFPETEIFEAD